MGYNFWKVSFALLVGSLLADAAVLPTHDSSTLIVGGQNATQGQFPYQLAIYSDTNQFSCGASLIQVGFYQVAITAAHCVNADTAHLLKLVSGKLYFNSNTGNEQERRVARAVRHPGFVYGVPYPDDIALLFLERFFDTNNNTNIVKLPEQLREEPTGNVTVSGFGRLFFGGQNPAILQHVQIPVVGWQECKDMWIAQNEEAHISKSHLCLGESTGLKSPCHGDSGGPAVNDKTELVGLVSWGLMCGDPSVPGIFTKVSYYLDWINETVANYKNSQKDANFRI